MDYWKHQVDRCCAVHSGVDSIVRYYAGPDCENQSAKFVFGLQRRLKDNVAPFDCCAVALRGVENCVYLCSFKRSLLWIVAFFESSTLKPHSNYKEPSTFLISLKLIKEDLSRSLFKVSSTGEHVVSCCSCGSIRLVWLVEHAIHMLRKIQWSLFLRCWHVYFLTLSSCRITLSEDISNCVYRCSW